MKRALITGISGQDGYYLARFLHYEHGYDVFGLGHSLHPSDKALADSLPFVRVLRGDLSDWTSLDTALKVARPHEVYNLAAQSSVELSFAEPRATAQTNAANVGDLLELIRRTGEIDGQAVRFYQASSSEMFGNGQHPPYNEETPMAPRSPYAAAKAHAHHLVKIYREGYGVHACSGICFNHESPRRPRHFVSRKITSAAAEIKLGLVSELHLGNLRARRDWGFAGDYVRAMWGMLQNDSPTDYVVATGRAHSVEQLVEVAFEAAGVDDWRQYVKDETESSKRPLEVDELVGDASKAQAELNWSPERSFEQMITLMVEADLRRLRNQANQSSGIPR